MIVLGGSHLYCWILLWNCLLISSFSISLFQFPSHFLRELKPSINQIRSCVYFTKPSPDIIHKKLQEFDHFPFHSQLIPPINETFRHLVVEETFDCHNSKFEEISQCLFQAKITNSLSWTSLEAINYPLKTNQTVGTLIQIYRLPVWTLNPCRILDCQVNMTSNEVCLSFGTLHSHLLKGIDRIKLTFLSSNQIIFRMESLSQAKNPIVRWFQWIWFPLQRKYLYEHLKSFQTIVKQLSNKTNTN